MTTPVGNEAARRRLARALVFVHEHDGGRVPTDVSVEVEALMLAGRAMDFAARLKDFSASSLNHAVVTEFAKQAALGERALLKTALPALKAADVGAYTDDGQAGRRSPRHAPSCKP
jgi:hypothetical protein